MIVQKKETVDLNHKQYLILNIGTHYFGVNVHNIEDVMKGGKTTSVPLAKKNIRGLLNLRGHIVTQIDVAKTLGIQIVNDNYTVVISNQDEFYSFSFGGVGDVIEIEENTIHPLPETVEKKWHHVAKGVHRLPKNLLVILDLNLLIEMIKKDETLVSSVNSVL